MHQLLDSNTATDFGKEIIPEVIKLQSGGLPLDGFWKILGQLRLSRDQPRLSFSHPSFNFYDEDMPIYTHRRHLPATKVNFCNMLP